MSMKMNAKNRRMLMARILVRDGSLCFYCGQEMGFKPGFHADFADDADWSLEHLINKRDGGSWNVKNLRLTHYRCNQIRHPLSMDQKIETVGMTPDEVGQLLKLARTLLRERFGDQNQQIENVWRDCVQQSGTMTFLDDGDIMAEGIGICSATS